MKRTALLAMMLAAAPAAAQICIVQKGGCQDIASGKVYEQQGGAYVDPETGEVKIAPPKEYQTTRPDKSDSEATTDSTRVNIQLKKYP